MSHNIWCEIPPRGQCKNITLEAPSAKSLPQNNGDEDGMSHMPQ